MAKFWMIVTAFLASGFAMSCGKNSVSTDTNANAGADVDADVDANANADVDTAGADADADADVDIDTTEDDDVSEDASHPACPNIAGVWTMICHSDITGGDNFHLNFFFFQDGPRIRGVEGGSEDGYCYGTVRSDGHFSLTMEEPCDGSTVTFTGVVVSPTLMNGRYSWEWTDAYGTSHNDEGAWYANPSPEYCSPCPSVAGDWALTYRDGRTEYTTVTIEQTNNAIRGQSLDGCEYLGALSLTSECNDLRIYRRCPSLAGQTEVLFGLLDSPSQMSGSWESMNDTFDCPEIRSGLWSADRL